VRDSSPYALNTPRAPDMSTPLAAAAAAAGSGASNPHVISRLEEELRGVDKNLERLAVRHYRTHIASSQSQGQAFQSARLALSALETVAASAARLQEGAGNAGNASAAAAAAAFVPESATAAGAAAAAAAAAADVLELPSLVEACVRQAFAGVAGGGPSGRAGGAAAGGLGGNVGGSSSSSAAAASTAEEDALDLLDYAASLLQQQTQLIAAGGVRGGGAVGGGSSPSPLLTALVARTRDAGGELAGLLPAAVAARAALPTVLRAASVIKRLRMQQQGLLRALGVVPAAPSSYSLPRPAAPSPLAAALAEAAITLSVRHDFLAARASLFARETEAASAAAAAAAAGGGARSGAAGMRGGTGGGGGGGVSSSSGSSTASASSALVAAASAAGAVDVHRVLLTELTNHYAAVCSSVALGRGSPVPVPSSLDLASRLLYANASASLSTWLAGALVASAAVDDGAGTSSLHQQLVYSARRCGRVGQGWEHHVAPLLLARVVEALVTGLATSRQRFSATLADICGPSASLSESGLRQSLASCWVELANATTTAVNCLRGAWTAPLARPLAAALRHHVDDAVLRAERCLVDCNNIAAAEASLAHLDSFVSAALFAVDVMGERNSSAGGKGGA
jgi:hypothetical protein